MEEVGSSNRHDRIACGGFVLRRRHSAIFLTVPA